MDPSCCRCGAAISFADLEERRAVIVMRRPFCGRCSDRIASSGGTTPRKLPLEVLYRAPPRLVAAAVVAVALVALAIALLARRPF